MTEYATFVGGPWHHSWLTRARLDDNRAAARRMGYTSADHAGVSLGYRPTDEVARCPVKPFPDGFVWRWAP